MSERLFLTLSEEEFQRFEGARDQLGMTRSQYVKYLMGQCREIRPAVIRYPKLIEKLSDAERDLRVLALKTTLSDKDRLLLYIQLEEILTLLRTKVTFGHDVQKSDPGITFGHDVQKSDPGITFGHDNQKPEPEITFGQNVQKSDSESTIGHNVQKPGKENHHE
jgi:hypothetical protein